MDVMTAVYIIMAFLLVATWGLLLDYFRRAYHLLEYVTGAVLTMAAISVSVGYFLQLYHIIKDIP